MKQIYLDHNATTPVDEEVLEAMLPIYREAFGNPSSQHKLGDQAVEALDHARDSVARLINCGVSKELVFTSGGTESVNHAIKGVALAKAAAPRPAVLNAGPTAAGVKPPARPAIC